MSGLLPRQYTPPRPRQGRARRRRAARWYEFGRDSEPYRLLRTNLQHSFSANKKWAISPLISPSPPEVHGSGLDKLVCFIRIRRFGEEFNRVWRSILSRRGGEETVQSAGVLKIAQRCFPHGGRIPAGF